MPIDNDYIESKQPFKSNVNKLNKLVKFANNKKVVKLATTGYAIFESLKPFIDKPTKLNFAYSTWSLFMKLVEENEMWPFEFFADWDIPYHSVFSPLIIETILAENTPVETYNTGSESWVVKISSYHGTAVGWLESTNDQDYSTVVYVEKGKGAEFKAQFANALWRKYKNNCLLMSLRTSFSNSGKSSSGNQLTSIAFENDKNSFFPLPSLRAKEISGYLSVAINKGVNRSIMLYGPPGTGKSTLARTLVDTLNLRSFRFRVEDLNEIGKSTIYEALEIFKPDVIIIDDFDRAYDQAPLLELIESFHKTVKVVIATVNRRDMIDESLMRPERFDELICIKRLDDDVIRSILGPEHCDMIDIMKDWPIAFVKEYVTRCQFMCKEQASKSVEELAARVARLSVYDDDQEYLAQDDV